MTVEQRDKESRSGGRVGIYKIWDYLRWGSPEQHLEKHGRAGAD